MGETFNEARTVKGKVSVLPYKNGLRVRWNVAGKRTELYVSETLPDYKHRANSIKALIEKDLVTGNYDETLQRYKELLKQVALKELLEEQLQHAGSQSRTIQPKTIDLVKEFERYQRMKDRVDDTNYYALTKKALIKWGNVTPDQIVDCLSKEKWSPKTFNDRRNCLNNFFDWLIYEEKITKNPLTWLANKERDQMHEDRQPFTDKEANLILDAFKTNRFVKKSSRYTHSQYYPFVAFLLHIGCRPSEAIGLKVRYVNFDDNEITIGNSLARTLEGTHAKARVYKSTKNKKVRHIPMDTFLISLLKPLCRDKRPDEFVFQNELGNVIDDKMFLRRVFKPIQESLKIPYRVTYACRHTFATRAVRQGMKPHEVAYLMGDDVNTVLKNYFHNDARPEKLPVGILSMLPKTG